VPLLPITVHRLAAAFYEAEVTRTPVPPISAAHPDITVRDAYLIQEALVLIMMGEGWTTTGIKVGATKKAVQEKFGTGEPVCSVMFRERQTKNGGKIETARLVQPRIEPEIAFRMGRPLSGPGVTRSDALAAVGGVMGAFEIVDCHTRDWNIGAAELIADNCVNAGYVLGPERPLAAGLDLAGVTVKFSKNGGAPSLGSGAQALGDPVEVLVWLANWLAERDRQLEKDWVVLSGGLADAFAAAPGDRFIGDFSDLGKVAVSFA
jgi:2-keto-4-pentenoate hydratase